MSFAGKTIIVTGASMGIGEAIAKKFHFDGARVFNFDKVEPTYKSDIEFRQVDTRDESQIEQAIKEFDSLDILVNNAGTYHLRSIEMSTLDIINEIIDTNLKGYMFMTKHCVPLLRSSKGNIVNISSALGTVPELDSPVYCSTKAGINMLTKCVAQEYARIPIRVNAVQPGPIDTPLLNAAFNSPDDRVQLAEMNPMGTIGKPEDVANMVYFLASDEMAGYVTGGLYPVDGGESSSSLYSKKYKSE